MADHEQRREDVVATHQFSLRLSGTGVADGELDARRHGELAARLGELASRIARGAAGQSGPGRSGRDVERVGALRLQAVEKGSTGLAWSLGADDLALVDPAHDVVVDRFWQVVEGIEAESPPDWVDAPVAEGAGRVLRALADSATAVEFKAPDRNVAFRPADLRGDVWRRTFDDVVGDDLTFTGTLLVVDLEKFSFRVTDDVGTRVLLEDVGDPHQVARLAGRRVKATGRRVTRDGRLLALREPTVEAFEVVSPCAPRPVDLHDLLASRPGPDPEGGVEFTEEEWQRFCIAIGRPIL